MKNYENQPELFEFKEIRRKVTPLKGDAFKKRVLELTTPEELLTFLQSRNFTRREFYFFLERTLFVYNQMRKSFFTDKLLWVTSRLLNGLLVVAGNFDRKNPARQHRNRTKNAIKKYELVLNSLTEFRANEIWDDEHLYKMLCISMDHNKLRGLIMRKLNRISLMAA